MTNMTTDKKPKQRYPSRDKTKYIAVPDTIYALVAKYADDHSTQFDKKSVAWAARQLLVQILTAEGYLGGQPEESPSEQNEE